MSKISTEWNNFKWWANQIGLDGQIEYLIGRMSDVDGDGSEEEAGLGEDSNGDAAGDESVADPPLENDTDPAPQDDTGDANSIGQ